MNLETCPAGTFALLDYRTGRGDVVGMPGVMTDHGDWATSTGVKVRPALLDRVRPVTTLKPTEVAVSAEILRRLLAAVPMGMLTPNMTVEAHDAATKLLVRYDAGQRIDEPLGFGAIVSDASDHSWFRVTDDPSAERPWRRAGTDGPRDRWANIYGSTLVREGLS